MLRQSSSRNQRSKGVKIKHVLQICLVVAICLWLVYQVKHSNDKRKEFSEHENGAKVPENTMINSNVEESLNLGRKGLKPQETEKTTNSDTHEEEEVEEEESKNEIEEQEQDIKNEEKEDEENQERGDGDDEIDELDQEKTEGEVDHEEEFMEDEEREKEEVEEKEYEEKTLKSENDDWEKSGRNTHEAREEHYKADDASSEVAHDTDTINTIEKISSENSGEHISNDTEVSKLGEASMADNSIYFNLTIGEDKGNETILIQPENGPLLNSTETPLSNNQHELNNNTTELSTEKHTATLSNDAEILNGSTVVQNVTVEVMVNGSQSDFNSTLITTMEDTNNSSNSTEGVFLENISTSNGTLEANDNQNEKSDRTEKTERTKDEENTDTVETNGNENENSDSTENAGTKDEENTNSIEHDHGDSSESVLQEERKNQIDLDTLPEMVTAGNGNEDDAAE